MVQDANGRILSVGDKVIIPATVMQLFPAEEAKVGLIFSHGEFAVIDCYTGGGTRLMAVPVQSGRLDQMLLALLESACKQHVDPRLPIPVWSEDLRQHAAAALKQAGIPDQPVTHVQVGNLQVPLGVIQWLGQACGVFPRQIGGGNAGT